VTVDGLEGAVVPAYDRRAADVGVVHLGLGAFARAHVATYCDRLLAAGHQTAGVCGVSLRSRTTVDALDAQDGLYTVIEREDDRADLHVIGSVLQRVHGPAGAVAALTVPTVNAVTLTVTEKGYCRNAATGELDESHPDIAHDIAHPDDPRSVPGVLLAALRRRRRAGLEPPVIVSCDNLSENGRATRSVVVALAGSVDEEMAAWLSEEVRFPSTMVDRIVPAPGEEDRSLVRERTGLIDRAALSCEPFSQWVIEDAAGLPPWEAAGAVVVDSVGPWETLKLRLLNGPHSALAYLGLLAGLETIADAAVDPALASFVTALAEQEVLPTLPPVATDPFAYAASCRHRFANRALDHHTAQVAMDGSQKLPMRLLVPMTERVAEGAEVERLGLVVAAWMTHVARCARGGGELEDPLAQTLVERVVGAPASSDGLVDALLGVVEVFGPDGLGDPSRRDPIVRGVRLLEERGPRGAAASLS
jgi:fructuronate reductase